MKKIVICLLATILTAFLSCPPSFADEISDLKAELKGMQKQIKEQARMMQEMQGKIERLEAVKPLPAAKGEGKVVAKAEEADPTTFRAYWKDGLQFETVDKNFNLKLGGRVQADLAWMQEGSTVKAELGKLKHPAEFRRIRVYTSGDIYKDYVYKIQIDFATGVVGMRDIYMGIKNVPYVDLIRVGQFTEPFSLEDMTSSNHTTFLERSLPYALSIHRNTGIGFNSSHLDDRLTVSWSAFFNADDQAIPTSNAFNTAARVTGLPWYEGDDKLLHLGAAYCYRNPPDKEDFSYSSEPEVHLAPDFVDTGEFAGRYANLVGLESALVYGPFSMQGEFIQSFVNMKNAQTGYFDGLYVYASYFLTGEHRNYNKAWACFGGVKPNTDFAFKPWHLGAWEIAARYSYLDFCSHEVNGGALTDLTLGVNWYLNANMKTMFNYVHAFRNGIGDADIIAVRAQVYF